MRLIETASNYVVLETRYCQVLFSYNTAVVVAIKDGKVLKTTHKHSRTTSKHMNRFLADYCRGKEVVEVPQDVVDRISN